MSKGKHSKKNNKSYNNLIFIISFIVILFLIIKSAFSTYLESDDISFNDYNSSNEETLAETISIEEIPENIVFSEDDVIKELIDTYIVEHHLNEDNFSFFYYNVNTKKEYFYNEMTQFTAASTVKLPVAMLYYDQINSGTLSSSDTLLYKSSAYESGGGLTASYYSPGNYVPIDFLLEQSIVNSDNTAVNILMNHLRIYFL